AGAEELEAAVDAALRCGYRHIDTAAFYLNEPSIGKVIQEKWIDTGKVSMTRQVFKRPASLSVSLMHPATQTKNKCETATHFVWCCSLQIDVSSALGMDHLETTLSLKKDITQLLAEQDKPRVGVVAELLENPSERRSRSL
ncbi:Aldo-keto reductase family 1 member A1, partial [Frankliniella fusca]